MVIDTSPTSGSATSARQSSVARAKPSCRAIACARSMGVSQSTASRGASTSPNTRPTAAWASAWHLPMKPVPISPTPIAAMSPLPRRRTTAR